MSEGVPYQFEVKNSASQLISEHAGLSDGEGSGTTATIAGRLMLRRDQGRVVFGVLQDSTDRIQLFATEKATPDFDTFSGLHLGDWLGVTGEVIKTKRGELSVRVDHWVRLAETRRPFPDKWHGISDTDIRYRQRYVDLWVNEDARKTFVKRSQVISSIRKWLEDRDFMEVETPVFHPIPGGAAARPFETHHNALDTDLFLRIAPELYLKRLVVGGFEKVFELARVFRNEGISTRHNPEFTMLELYQAYADYGDIMTLVEELVSDLALKVCGTTRITYGDRELDLSTPWQRSSLIELLSEKIGVDVNLQTPLEELRNLCAEREIPIEQHYGAGKLLLELYEKTTEPELWGPVFVTDYPREVSPLSREHRTQPGLVERFEGVIAGRELCNAFSEVVDPDDQRSRFVAQEEIKNTGDDEAMTLDEDYLRALEYGLPPTGGLGIGIDRLVMLLTNTQTIRDVIFFPTLRPEQK